jgi:hypothetical protein
MAAGRVEMKPPGQGLHCALGMDENVPGAQSTHVVVVFEYRPIVQLVHAVAEEMVLNEPPGHGMHAPAEPEPGTGEKVPAKHGVQTVPPCAYVPAAQMVQLIAPLPGAMKPPGHA